MRQFQKGKILFSMLDQNYFDMSVFFGGESKRNYFEVSS